MTIRTHTSPRALLAAAGVVLAVTFGSGGAAAQSTGANDYGTRLFGSGGVTGTSIGARTGGAYLPVCRNSATGPA